MKIKFQISGEYIVGKPKLDIGLKSLNWAATKKENTFASTKTILFNKYFETLKVSLSMFRSTTKLTKINHFKYKIKILVIHTNLCSHCMNP